MNIKIGSTVVGTNGKLGEISRLMADEHTHRVDELVVKYGLILGGERVIPLEHVTGIEDDAIQVDLDRAGFESMDMYSDQAYHDPNSVHVTTPLVDQQGAPHGEFVLTTTDNPYPLEAPAPAAMTAQSNQQTIPREKRPPVISRRTPILDVSGEKTGEVGDFSVSEVGIPTRLVMRSGLFTRHDLEIPIAWIQDLTTEGIQLSVPKETVEGQAHRQATGQDTTIPMPSGAEMPKTRPPEEDS